jgi:hypothetical protein
MDVRHYDLSGSASSHDDAVILRARDVLMEWFEVSAGDANRLLVTWSRRSGTPLRTLAVALISDIYEGKPSGCTPQVVRRLEQDLREVSGR